MWAHSPSVPFALDFFAAAGAPGLYRRFLPTPWPATTSRAAATAWRTAAFSAFSAAFSARLTAAAALFLEIFVASAAAVAAAAF